MGIALGVVGRGRCWDYVVKGCVRGCYEPCEMSIWRLYLKKNVFFMDGYWMKVKVFRFHLWFSCAR